MLLVWNDSSGSAISLHGSRGPPGDVAVSSPAVAASLPRFPTPGSASERGVSAARTESRRRGQNKFDTPCTENMSALAIARHLLAASSGCRFRPTANPAAYKKLAM
jgi:hypothetical protein